MGIACKGGVPEWRRNLTHELNLGDKPECNNEYGDEEVDEDDHYDREDEDDNRYGREDDNDDNNSVAIVGDGTLPFPDMNLKCTNMKSPKTQI